MFLFNMAANFVHPVTPTIILNLQLDEAMFGLAFSAMMAFNFLFSPLWARLAGIISSKRVMLIGALGYALGQVFFGLARTEIQFLLARLFAGAFCGGSYVAFLTYTVNQSSPENRGKMITLQATLIAVSNSFGYFIGGLGGEIHPYLPVWVQVGTLACCGVLHYFLCREDHLENAPRLTPRLFIRQCNPFSALWQCRRYVTMLLGLLFLSYGLGNLGYIAFEQCFNFYLKDQFHLSSGYNGVIKAALGFLSLAANGTLCLWILRRKHSSPYLLLVMGICTAAMAGALISHGMIPFIIINVVFFAFYFVSMPLMQHKAAELGQGEGSNLVMGAFNGVKSFASIFGAALAGVMYHAHARLPFLFGLIAFGGAAAVMAALCRREKGDACHPKESSL